MSPQKHPQGSSTRVFGHIGQELEARIIKCHCNRGILSAHFVPSTTHLLETGTSSWGFLPSTMHLKPGKRALHAFIQVNFSLKSQIKGKQYTDISK